MPTFENGWICRECWSANRETDQRCYRCHATPKYREVPQATTVSETDSKPAEERTKVTSLTAPTRPPATPLTPVEPASPPATPAVGPIGQLSLFGQLRSWVARVVARVSWLWALVRAVPRVPGATRSLVTMRVHAVARALSSSLRGVLAHRRAWLTLAWVISAGSCAILFSVAFKAPVAASMLVVAGVAILSALTTALTSNAMERQPRSASPERHPDRAESRDQGLAATEHPTRAAEILGGRAAR